MSKVSELDKLTKEYKKWTEKNDYPHIGAEELLPQVRSAFHATYLRKFMERWEEAEKIDSTSQQDRAKGVHLSHCYQGENENGCKYGEHDSCPAKPKNEVGENPLNLTDEEIGDLNAWLSFDDAETLAYVGAKVSKLIREAMVRNGYI